MAAGQHDVLRERTNLRAIVAAVAALVVGVLLLTAAAQESWWHGRSWAGAVVRELGALVVATVAISLLWESAVRHAILEEFWTKAKVGDSVRRAGLLHVSDSFHQDIDWKALFDGAARVDLFFAYGRTWRNTHAEELRQLMLREDGRLRVVLPDPDDRAVTTELGRRFSMSAEQLSDNIKESRDFFLALSASGGNRGNVQLWLLPMTPMLTFYRFDRRAVFTVYNHQRERAPVPTFTVEQGGGLYDFIRQEFDAMIRADSGLARRVL